MKITIKNYLSGSFLLEQEPNTWDAIVILDSKLSHSEFVAEHARRHLYLRFDDVETEIQGKQAPSSAAIRGALGFAEASNQLIVCCRAGQSRSAAVAFVICFEKLGSEAAYHLLNSKRHIPNSMIIELGAAIVENPTLLSTFNQWKSDNRQVKLSDYYDEIEQEFDKLGQQGARNRIVR